MNFKIPADSAYLQILGRATYNFAYLEWQIVHLGEKISPGFLAQVTELTAGRMARKFEDAVEVYDEKPELSAPLKHVSDIFLRIVSQRNKLMHGNPGTVDNRQRLIYPGPDGLIWEVPLIEAFAFECEALAIDANAIYNNRL